jgi:hypothetical protein
VGRVCSTQGVKRNVYTSLLVHPQRERTLGRPRRRWVDNIKMDLREITLGAFVTGLVWLRMETNGGLF